MRSDGAWVALLSGYEWVHEGPFCFKVKQREAWEQPMTPMTGVELDALLKWLVVIRSE